MYWNERNTLFYEQNLILDVHLFMYGGSIPYLTYTPSIYKYKCFGYLKRN
jgi:hypothetical protein